MGKMSNIAKLACSSFLLVSLFTSSIVSAATIKDCAGQDSDAKLDHVTISDCPSTPGGACPLVQGTNASIEVDFTSTKPFKSAKVEIYGKIGIVKIPFPLSPSEACGNYGFNCPVTPNEPKKLHISLPVLRTYPRIGVTVQLNLLDENRKPIVCVEFPAKIIASQ